MEEIGAQMLWEEEEGPEVLKGCQGGMIMLEEKALPLEKSSGDWDRKAEEVRRCGGAEAREIDGVGGLCLGLRERQ